MNPRKIRKPKPVKTNCIYCNENKVLDYKDTQELKKYLTERGKIIGKARTGVCAKHERELGRVVKQARYIGLLPFVSRPS